MTLRALSPPSSLDDLLELLAVLAALDRLDGGADQLDAVLLEDAGLVEGHRAVERGLAAEGGQQRVGALLGDDLLDVLGRDRLDVGRVGELGVGHDRGRVGVDQDDPQALLAQHPARLGAGVVELAGLADDDRPGADDQDGLDVGALGHVRPSFLSDMRSTNRSKRYAASCGPAAASGWYCTEKLVSSPSASRSSRPSTTSSLRQTWLTVASPNSVVVAALERGVDGEAVVVGGDLDLAGGAVHDRLVDAAVAVLQLVGAEAERAAEELVAEADAEVGQSPARSAPCSSSTWAVVAAGSPGPLEKNSPSGPTARTSSMRRGRGEHVHLDAALAHHPRACWP